MLFIDIYFFAQNQKEIPVLKLWPKIRLLDFSNLSQEWLDRLNSHKRTTLNVDLVYHKFFPDRTAKKCVMKLRKT